MNAPAHWTLADRAGNRVCICAWPDGHQPWSYEPGVEVSIGLPADH